MLRRSFTTRAFMRHAPNALLQEFFGKREELSDFDWDSLATESKIEPLYRAFMEMPDDQRKIVEGIFRQVHDLSHEGGIKTLITEGEGPYHNLKLRQDLKQFKTFEEKALWMQIHHEKVVKVASFFQHANHFGETSWKSRTGIPGRAPRVLIEELKCLADEVSKFHVDTLGCGHHGKVENYLRSGPPFGSQTDREPLRPLEADGSLSIGKPVEHAHNHQPGSDRTASHWDDGRYAGFGYTPGYTCW